MYPDAMPVAMFEPAGPWKVVSTVYALPRESVTDAIASTARPFAPTTITVSPAATPVDGTVSFSVFEASSVTDLLSTVCTNTGAVPGGGGGATGPLAVEAADAEPPAFVALTTTRTVRFTSAAVSVYVLAFAAPGIAAQFAPPPSQRCHS